MELLDTLKELEIAMHEPATRDSASSVGEHLHPGFREFGRSGKIYSRAEIIGHVSAAEQQPKIWAQDFEVEVLSEEFALLTYRSAHLSSQHTLERHTNRSSLWQHFDGKWALRIHQGTPCEPFNALAT